MIRSARKISDHDFSQAAQRRYVFEVNARTADDRLEVVWEYSRNLHSLALIEDLANTFEQEVRLLVSYCQSHDLGINSPSDFPLAGLDEQRLEKLSNLIDAMEQRDTSRAE